MKEISIKKALSTKAQAVHSTPKSVIKGKQKLLKKIENAEEVDSPVNFMTPENTAGSEKAPHELISIIHEKSRHELISFINEKTPHELITFINGKAHGISLYEISPGQVTVNGDREWAVVETPVSLQENLPHAIRAFTKAYMDSPQYLEESAKLVADTLAAAGGGM